MNTVKTTCPNCRNQLEFPIDFHNIICIRCQSSFRVRTYGGTIDLEEVDADAWSERREIEGKALIDARLAELDELEVEAEAEIEATRGREQSGPLQLGCAFFGLFLGVIAVIVLFMVAARSYIGSWIFYLAIAAILALGLSRIRNRSQHPGEVSELRSKRERLESGLAELRTERERILELRDRLQGEHHTNPPQQD